MARILILEDDEVFADHLIADLKEEGHETHLCFGATEAVAYAKTYPFDLLIADVFVKRDGRFIPEGGILLINNVRNVMGLKVPIIAISGSFVQVHGTQISSSAITVGADETLAKPFQPQELHDCIARLLAKNKAGVY